MVQVQVAVVVEREQARAEASEENNPSEHRSLLLEILVAGWLQEKEL